MYKKIKSSLLIASTAVLISSCTGFFDKDNTPTPTPLAKLTPSIAPKLLWQIKAGQGSGSVYSKMNPTLAGNIIYIANANGVITAIHKATGKIYWQTNTAMSLSTSAGVGDGIVVAGNQSGHLVALAAATGKKIWTINLAGKILAKPVVAKNKVIVKTVDGYIRALAANDGHEVWSFQQVEPNLLLNAASAPLIYDSQIVVGFANGNLAKINLNDGQIIWMQSIAVPQGVFAIERMIDIDADPILFENHLYAATYQGKIAALNWHSGHVIWQEDISSYTGMGVDANSIYITDAKSLLWSFDRNNGNLRWKQNQLVARVISAPATYHNYLVLGDAEGYLHWLNKHDGHVVAREKLSGALYATPFVDNNNLYAYSSNGYLFAYTLTE